MNALISNDRVVEIKNAAGETRYYIAMGRPGFNLRANNMNGYATKQAAEKASLKCEGR
jgi:ribosomal protein S11